MCGTKPYKWTTCGFIMWLQMCQSAIEWERWLQLLCYCWVFSGPWSTARRFLTSMLKMGLSTIIPTLRSVLLSITTFIILSVLGVTLTWVHAVVIIILVIMEIGISLMEPEWNQVTGILLPTKPYIMTVTYQWETLSALDSMIQVGVVAWVS